MRPERVGLVLVLLVYIALACGYAWFTPPWNNPDEPAHYNYIVFVAEKHALPELVDGDWDASLLSQAIPERFHPRFDASPIRYESHQPPLYYLISAPVYSATSNAPLRARVLALRAISIVLGLGLAGVVFALVREIAPQRPWLSPLAAAVATLVPMVTASAASINNDMLSMLLASMATLMMVRWTIPSPASLESARPGLGSSILVGALIGMLLLTKLTVYAFAIVLPLTAFVVAVTQRESARRSAHLRGLIVAIVVAMIVSGWWFIRNAGVYGWDDILAQRRHDAVVVGQPRYADFGPTNWLYLAVTVFRSYFAQFGWMTIVVDSLTYGLYACFTLMAMVGLRLARREHIAGQALLIVLTAAVFGQLLLYNLSFIQAQGRYLFPAIASISTLLSLGWVSLTGRVGGRGELAVLAWVALAIATAVGGIGNWDVGIASGLTFLVLLGTLVIGHAGFAENDLVLMARSGAPPRLTGNDAEVLPWRRALSPIAAQWFLVAATVAALGALNLMCLTRYVIPFYRG